MLRQERKENLIKCAIKHNRQEKTVEKVWELLTQRYIANHIQHQWPKFTN